MNKKTLIILALVAAVAIGAVYMKEYAGQDTTAEATGAMLPELANKLDDVNKVVIANAEADPAVTLELVDGRWLVAEKGGYPADVGKLRKQLRALAAAEIIEPMTSKPDFYARLGVQDVATEGSTATAVRVSGASGSLGAVLIGDSTTRGNANVGYARREGDAQALLVSGDFSITQQPDGWLVKDIVKLAPADVWKVEIQHADGEVLSAVRPESGKDLALQQPLPEGRSLKYAAVANGLTQPVQNMRLEDVRKHDPAVIAGQTVATSIYTRVDGLILTVKSWKEDSKRWVTLDAKHDASAVLASSESAEGDESSQAADPKAAIAEVEQLNKLVNGWAYQISAHSGNVLNRRMTDMLADLPEAATE